MENLKELITLTNTDINSGEITYQLNIALTHEHFKELGNDINYLYLLNEFHPPHIIGNKFYGHKDTGVRIEHFYNKLILQLLPKTTFTANKVFLMANIINGQINEYIDSNDYKDGFQNSGLYKLHIATSEKVDELLGKYYSIHSQLTESAKRQQMMVIQSIIKRATDEEIKGAALTLQRLMIEKGMDTLKDKVTLTPEQLAYMQGRQNGTIRREYPQNKNS